MRAIILPLIVLFSTTFYAQNTLLPINNFEQEFKNAYQQYPAVPRGLLEAVSFTMTHFQHVQPIQESCTGLPNTYGVMGLTLDGKNYFKNNLNYIATVSGISVEEIISNPQKNILAYAAAYQYQLSLLSPFYHREQNYAQIISSLSELPNKGLQNEYALNAHVYSVLSFMNNPVMQKRYNFPSYQMNLEHVFGKDNLQILSASQVLIGKDNIQNEKGQQYKYNNNKTIDYPPALWDQADGSNYSSRNGTFISAVTIHTIQGSYAGAISWFKNPSANVSAHYVLRSVDGQVTQMVLEADKGWHVGSENPYTIGLEHEGFVNDSSWYTAAMYQSSADLVRDITQSGYGINPLRTGYFPWMPTSNYNATGMPGGCIRIKGHQHYPNQTHTDPGSNWDWDYFYKLINDPFTTVTSNTNASGNTTDSGGASGNYGDDERTLFLIQPVGAVAITLTVNQFDIEAGWDYLYIYDGATVFDPLIGRYDGTSIPPTINVLGSEVLIEFRTDCATTAPGYDISWTSSVITGIENNNNHVFSAYPNPTTENVTLNFNEKSTGYILIRDGIGRTIYTQYINEKLFHQLSLESFSNGIYFIQFQSTSNNQTIKLIKQ